MVLKNRAIFGSGLFLLILAGSFVVGQFDSHDEMNHSALAHSKISISAPDRPADNAASDMHHAMPASLTAEETAAASTEHHSHTLYDVSHMDLPPQLSLRIVDDAMSGWNIQLVTDNFELSPEKVNQPAVDGQGHAHLYVNEKKVARLYAHWYHLDDLPPGRHSVKVQLNGNDHATLSMGPNPIEVVGLVTQR